MTHIFKTIFDQHKERNGEECDIIRTITEPEEFFDAEVLPMYQIRFRKDGEVIDAFTDEVTVDADNPRFYAEPEDSYSEDSGRSFGLDTYQIVDTANSGVIAYCHKDNAGAFVNALQNFGFPVSE